MGRLPRVWDDGVPLEPGAKRSGISDVARAAGVSATTVSHALNGRGQVSAATREKVMRAATELGYAPNRIASALRRQRSGLVGFVGDEIATTPFAGRLVLGAQDAAGDLDVLLMVVNSNRDELVERRQINALLAQQVDAIVYAKMFHQAVEVPRELHGVPTVLVDAYDANGAFPAVVPDEKGIAESAMGLLLSAGHRRIAHFTIAAPTPAQVGRLHGYRVALDAAGLPLDESLVVRVTAERGAEATGLARAAFGRFLDEGGSCTAVFCFNDQFAMGVYQAAAQRGLAVPDDLSVVGVDNLEIVAAGLSPSLTTVALPHYEMGRWAVTTAMELVSGRTSVSGPWPLRMPCRVVHRDSVSPPAAMRVPDVRAS